jgi:hypothetical protein
MSDTDISELRERDTVPRGLEPPPFEPPQNIDGAPEWAKSIFQEVRATRKEVTTLVQNTELIKREFSSFRAETRGRFHSHEVELEQIRMELNDNSDEHSVFREKLDRAERLIDELRAEMRAKEGDGK